MPSRRCRPHIACGVAISARSDAKRWRSNSSNGTWGRSVTLIVSSPGLGIRMEGRDELCVHAEALGDHERCGTGCRAAVRRCRGSRSAAPASAGVCSSKVPIFELSGQCAGAVAVEVRLSVRAGDLAIRSIGVDGQPFGQRDCRRSQLGGRVATAPGRSDSGTACRGRRAHPTRCS